VGRERVEDPSEGTQAVNDLSGRKGAPSAPTLAQEASQGPAIAGNWVPLTFSQGAWRASGTESLAVDCGGAPVPGTQVTLTLTVLSGQTGGSGWRAKDLKGTNTVNSPPTSAGCPAANSVDDLATS
jgi:hypothetical protein